MIRIPSRLFLVALAVLGGIPLATIETWVSSRRNWERVLSSKTLLWSSVAAVILVFMARQILVASKSSEIILRPVVVVWCLLSGWLAIRTENPSLAFFTLFNMAYWYLVLNWLHAELGRAYLDPEMEWYQGAPSSIPGLECVLHKNDQNVVLKASRLDRDGVFLFSEKLIPPWCFDSRTRHQLTLDCRGRTVRVSASPIRMIQEGKGLGMRFEKLTPDQKKELGDFVEQMRGQGYVF